MLPMVHRLPGTAETRASDAVVEAGRGEQIRYLMHTIRHVLYPQSIHHLSMCRTSRLVRKPTQRADGHDRGCARLVQVCLLAARLGVPTVVVVVQGVSTALACSRSRPSRVSHPSAERGSPHGVHVTPNYALVERAERSAEEDRSKRTSGHREPPPLNFGHATISELHRASEIS